jgi:hypothetical protein
MLFADVYKVKLSFFVHKIYVCHFSCVCNQEENLRLISEMQKCEGLLNEKDKGLERQALGLQKEVC